MHIWLTAIVCALWSGMVAVANLALQGQSHTCWQVWMAAVSISWLCKRFVVQKSAEALWCFHFLLRWINTIWRISSLKWATRLWDYTPIMAKVVNLKRCLLEGKGYDRRICHCNGASCLRRKFVIWELKWHTVVDTIRSTSANILSKAWQGNDTVVSSLSIIISPETWVCY